MDVFWFLPTHGDGHYLGTTQGARPVTLNYLKQVAQAADSLGYHGVLIPTGRSCEDSWVIASALVPLTERLRYLVAIRPGIISPTVSARMAATLDRLSNGRLLINVVTGGDPDENRGDGSFLDHSERYEVSDEFLKIWRRVLQGESVDFEGKHLRVQNAKALYPPVQKPYPPLYFGGSSDAAHDLAAVHDGRRDNLEIAPNLWAGVGLVRGGAGTALVGNPQQVAERIKEYADLGIESFIFSGYPHLEEAYRFAELVFPLLPEPYASLAGRGITNLTGPFGEMIANDVLPNKS